MSRRRRPALALLLALTAFTVLPATDSAVGAAPAKAAEATKVEILGPTEPRRILLDPTQDELTGNLHVTVRNGTATRQLLRVIYARTQDGVTTLPKASSKFEVSATPGRLTKDRTLVVLPVASVSQIEVRFTLPSDASPSSLDGLLALETRPTGEPSDFTQLPTLSVAGQIRPIGDVRFDPKGIDVQVTRWCVVPSLCNATSGGTVRLIGADVGQFVQLMEKSGRSSIVTQLQRDGGSPIEATLSSIALTTDQPGTATAHVTLQEAGPGAYSGALPLSRLAADPPTLAIKVSSRYWFLWAFLPIFLGVLAAELLTRQVALGRRKNLIRDALRREARAHHAAEPLNFPAGREQALIWTPTVEWPLKDDSKWSYYEELKTVRSVYTAVRWARNDADLDEAETNAMVLIIGLKARQLMLTQVRRLWDLVSEKRERPTQWAQTNVEKDAQLLLRRVNRVQTDQKADSDLLDKLGQHLTWHERFALAWDLRNRLMDAGAPTAEGAEEVDLVALDQLAGRLFDRTQDAQDERDLELDLLLAELHELEKKSSVQAPKPSKEPGLRAAALGAELASLKGFAGNAGLAISSLGVQMALREDPAPTTAPAHAPAVAAAVAVAAASTTAVANTEPDDRSPGRRLSDYKRVDLVLSLLTVVLSAIVYEATVYDSTWGAPADWVTAFGAGFTGQVVVKWALLPISRSIRLRAKPVPSPAAAT